MIDSDDGDVFWFGSFFAKRICAMVHELRRRAFAEAVRYQERNRSPAVILKLVPNA